MNKVSIKRGDKTYTTQIKDFNFACGSLNINSGEPEFSVSRCSGSYTLDNVTYSDIADIEKMPAKTEISSPYFATNIPDVCLSQYSQYDKVNKNVGYSLKGYIFDKIDKQKYGGFQLRPYAISPSALASHILKDIYPNIIPYTTVWEYGNKRSAVRGMNSLTVEGNRIKCNNPYGLYYGFKFRATSDSFYVNYKNNSTTRCEVHLVVCKSQIVNGKVEPNFSDVVQDTKIEMNSSSTATLSIASVVGQDAYFFVYANCSQNDSDIIYNPARTQFVGNLDITINAIYGGGLQWGAGYVGTTSPYPVVDKIPYPRLEPSTVEDALNKVLPLLQSTAIESDDYKCLCGTRTTGSHIWNNDYMLYDTPKKIGKTYLYGDADIMVAPTNAYDSVEMTYSVGTEAQETIDTNVDVSRSTIDYDKFNYDGYEGVAMKNVGSATTNRMLYAFVKKKISVSGKILYKYDGTSSDVVSGSGYNPWSANESDNKTTTFKAWGGTHHWYGLQPESFLVEIGAELSNGNEGGAYPNGFYSAICPIDETSCYLMVALPVERSNSLTNAYQIHDITISSTLNTVQYQDKSLVVGENPVSIASSELICSDAAAQGLASTIVEDYHTGIMTATINTFPTVAKRMPAINEICEVESFEDENKIPIAWQVTRREYDYSGAMYEKLGLREYICNKLIYKQEGTFGEPYTERIIGTLKASAVRTTFKIDEIYKWLSKYRSFAMRISMPNADGVMCEPFWVYSSRSSQDVELNYGTSTETMKITSCYFSTISVETEQDYISFTVGTRKDYDRPIELLEFVLQS